MLAIGTSNLSIATGSCYRCSRNERLVDLDVHIEAEGSLALCAPCILEAAETAGLSFNSAYVSEILAELVRRSPETVNALTAEIASHLAHVADLERRLELAEASKLDSLRIEALLQSALNKTKPAAPARKAPNA